MTKPHPKKSTQHGNVIFFILLAIVLVGLLIAAMRGGTETASIDKEQIALKISQVRQYTHGLEHAVDAIYQNLRSESNISFAHFDADGAYGTFETNPDAEVFHVQGGGAEYAAPPSGINDGTSWEFYGTTAAPDVGTDAADLIAVLPNVTPEFCTAINVSLNQTGTMQDTGTCIYEAAGTRFTGTFSNTPNTMNTATFSTRPAPHGCVTCTNGTRHYYHVLLPR